MNNEIKKQKQQSRMLLQLDKYNFANLFNVVNLGSKSFYNISRTIQFNNISDIPEYYYELYQISAADTWTSISYNFYGTIKLWWLICKFNNITEPFMQLIPRNYFENSILVFNKSNTLAY